MQLENLKFALEHEWEEQRVTYSKDKYWVSEKIEYKHGEEYGLISCGISEEKYFYGEVEYKINVNDLINNSMAWFGYLEVNQRVENLGIGSCLMNIVINNIRLAKQYWNIDKKVRLSGWLSREDHKNNNWSKSVPFYIKQADKNDCEFELKINDDSQSYHTVEDFFANVGTKDGNIIYCV